jgi:hypothetical protein
MQVSVPLRAVAALAATAALLGTGAPHAEPAPALHGSAPSQRKASPAPNRLSPGRPRAARPSRPASRWCWPASAPPAGWCCVAAAPIADRAGQGSHASTASHIGATATNARVENTVAAVVSASSAR